VTEVAISGRALLDQAAERLRRAGVESPRLAARRLWSDLQGDATLLALLTDDAALDSATAAQYLGWVERLAAGEPLAYVTGWTGFRHLRLRCDARALIPRPETEVLVELALARVRNGTVADIGTGTGAIALALRQEGEFTSVIGVDCSADALALAAENGAMLGLAVERLGDGRAVVREGGWMALELDCRRAAATAALAEGFGWREVLVQDDLFGRARYLLARRGSA
jgi:release factor glutamine methyltransferase